MRQLLPHIEMASEIAEDAHWEQDLGLSTKEQILLSDYLQQMFHLLDRDISYFLPQYVFWGEWINVLMQAACEPDLPMTFWSSPTSGIPSACSHRKVALQQEVEFLQNLIRPTQRIVSLLPHNHLYGYVFGVLLPDSMNIEVLDAQNQSMIGLFTELREGDTLIAYPDWWTELANAELALPKRCLGISATAPLAVNTALRLQKQGFPMLEIYGSAESGGLGYRRLIEEPFELFPYWRHSPHIRSQLHRMYPDRSVSPAVLPPEYLSWESTRHFRVNGRRDQAIDMDGYLIFPQQIAERIENLPQVQSCWIRKMKTEEGVGLKCWVIPRPQEEPSASLRTYLQLWFEQYLSPQDRPSHIVISDQSPFNEWDKVQDWGIQKYRPLAFS